MGAAAKASVAYDRSLPRIPPTCPANLCSGPPGTSPERASFLQFAERPRGRSIVNAALEWRVIRELLCRRSWEFEQEIGSCYWKLPNILRRCSVSYLRA